MLRCPACLDLYYANYADLSSHLLEKAQISDPSHIMWLNRYIATKRVTQTELSRKLDEFFDAKEIKHWIIAWMIRKFFGE